MSSPQLVVSSRFSRKRKGNRVFYFSFYFYTHVLILSSVVIYDVVARVAFAARRNFDVDRGRKGGRGGGKRRRSLFITYRVIVDFNGIKLNEYRILFEIEKCIVYTHTSSDS